jgi:hypothetical protein
MKKILIALVFSLLLSGCIPEEFDFKSKVPVTDQTVVITPVDKPKIPSVTAEQAPQAELPKSVNRAVPFFPQAPDGNWDLPWEEACEEASLTLAYAYATGETLTKDDFRQKVLDMVEWEKKTFGFYEDTTVAYAARILTEFLNFTDFEVMEDATVEKMKTALAEGDVIVAPFAGRLLKNPFYSGEGPVYHMLVIRGYDEENFITNDVGTRRGENFIYPYERIMEALHDYDPRAMTYGARTVIVVRKSS